MADFIDKAKHKAEEIGGAAKESIGDATGNDDLKAEGKADQTKANVSQTADKVSDVAGDAKDAIKDKTSDLEGTANDVKETVKDKASDLDGTANEVKDAVADKAQEAKHQLSSAADEFSSKVQNLDTNDVQSAVKSNLPVIVAGAAAALVAVFFIAKKKRDRKIAAQNFNWSGLVDGLADSWSELKA